MLNGGVFINFYVSYFGSHKLVTLRHAGGKASEGRTCRNRTDRNDINRNKSKHVELDKEDHKLLKKIIHMANVRRIFPWSCGIIHQVLMEKGGEHTCKLLM